MTPSVSPSLVSSTWAPPTPQDAHNARMSAPQGQTRHLCKLHKRELDAQLASSNHNHNYNPNHHHHRRQHLQARQSKHQQSQASHKPNCVHYKHQTTLFGLESITQSPQQHQQSNTNNQAQLYDSCAPADHSDNYRDRHQRRQHQRPTNSTSGQHLLHGQQQPLSPALHFAPPSQQTTRTLKCRHGTNNQHDADEHKLISLQQQQQLANVVVAQQTIFQQAKERRRQMTMKTVSQLYFMLHLSISICLVLHHNNKQKYLFADDDMTFMKLTRSNQSSSSSLFSSIRDDGLMQALGSHSLLAFVSYQLASSVIVLLCLIVGGFCSMTTTLSRNQPSGSKLPQNSKEVIYSQTIVAPLKSTLDSSPVLVGSACLGLVQLIVVGLNIAKLVDNRALLHLPILQFAFGFLLMQFLLSRVNNSANNRLPLAPKKAPGAPTCSMRNVALAHLLATQSLLWLVELSAVSFVVQQQQPLIPQHEVGASRFLQAQQDWQQPQQFQKMLQLQHQSELRMLNKLNPLLHHLAYPIYDQQQFAAAAINSAPPPPTIVNNGSARANFSAAVARQKPFLASLTATTNSTAAQLPVASSPKRDLTGRQPPPTDAAAGAVTATRDQLLGLLSSAALLQQQQMKQWPTAGSASAPSPTQTGSNANLNSAGQRRMTAFKQTMARAKPVAPFEGSSQKQPNEFQQIQQVKQQQQSGSNSDKLTVPRPVHWPTAEVPAEYGDEQQPGADYEAEVRKRVDVGAKKPVPPSFSQNKQPQKFDADSGRYAASVDASGGDASAIGNGSSDDGDDDDEGPETDLGALLPPVPNYGNDTDAEETAASDEEPFAFAEAASNFVPAPMPIPELFRSSSASFSDSFGPPTLSASDYLYQRGKLSPQNDDKLLASFVEHLAPIVLQCHVLLVAILLNLWLQSLSSSGDCCVQDSNHMNKRRKLKNGGFDINKSFSSGRLLWRSNAAASATPTAQQQPQPTSASLSSSLAASPLSSSLSSNELLLIHSAQQRQQRLQAAPDDVQTPTATSKPAPLCGLFFGLLLVAGALVVLLVGVDLLSVATHFVVQLAATVAAAIAALLSTTKSRRRQASGAEECSCSQRRKTTTNAFHWLLLAAGYYSGISLAFTSSASVVSLRADDHDEPRKLAASLGFGGGGGAGEASVGRWLQATRGALIVVQVTLQTLALANSTAERKKQRARQVFAFLIFANLSLWVLDVCDSQRQQQTSNSAPNHATNTTQQNSNKLFYQLIAQSQSAANATLTLPAQQYQKQHNTSQPHSSHLTTNQDAAQNQNPPLGGNIEQLCALLLTLSRFYHALAFMAHN